MPRARMLRYLDKVARIGSIRRAAARLNVASSAINRRILDLEAALGGGSRRRRSRRFRATKVTMRVMSVPEILRGPAEGEADLGLGYALPDSPALTLLAEFDGNLGAVVAPDHPLIMADPAMRMHDLVRDALVRGRVDGAVGPWPGVPEPVRHGGGSARGRLVFVPLQQVAALIKPPRLVYWAGEALDPAALMLADEPRAVLA